MSRKFPAKLSSFWFKDRKLGVYSGKFARRTKIYIERARIADAKHLVKASPGYEKIENIRILYETSVAIY